MSTLSELRTAAYKYYGEGANVVANDYTATEVLDSLNQAYRDIYDFCLELGSTHGQSSCLVSWVADTQEYLFSALSGAPSVRLVKYVQKGWESGASATSRQELFPADVKDQVFPFNSLAGGVPTHYYLLGAHESIGFLPIPSSTLTNNVKVWYMPNITALSGDSDTPSLVPAHFHDIIAMSAAIKMKVMAGLNATDLYALYQEQMKNMRFSLKRAKHDHRPRHNSNDFYIGDY